MDTSLNQGLRIWAARHQINLNSLAEQLGLSYQQVYRMVCGDLPISQQVIGRLLVRFGPSAVNEINYYMEGRR